MELNNHPPLSSAETELLTVVQPYTMLDALRLAALHRLTREIVSSGIEGELVECGVCNGGSAAAIAAAAMDRRERRLWLYDTFAGIPPAGPRDGEQAARERGTMIGSVANVEEVLQKVGFPRERVVLRPGAFHDTFTLPRPARVALLHIDADWYDSVLSCLDVFYPAVPVGGVVVLDDFGYWEGTRRAFYDYCARTGEKPLLERNGFTQAFWRKGKEHTRAEVDRYLSGLYWSPT